MTLKDCISFNKDFKSGINLYLSLNKTKKIESYIPTSSSLRILNDYIYAVLNNKEQATILIGPYGKGKSHLLLVLLSLLSLDRNSKNRAIVKKLIGKIHAEEPLGKETINNIESIWKKKPYLPVILNSTGVDLNQAFLIAISDALNRAGLQDLVPDTYFSVALERISNWENDYPETFSLFTNKLQENNYSIDEFTAALKRYSYEALKLFQDIYPSITSGSEFNPLTSSDVLPLYKSISEQLVENYDYSGIYIVFDEFSKFIESQDGKAAGSNMKLLQDMCELSSDSQNSQLHITFVAHKSIKEYGNHLSKETINAFTGIEGRLVEKYFITSSKNNYELVKNAIIKTDEFDPKCKYLKPYLNDKTANEYYELPVFRANFKYEDFYNIILKGCYPLDPVASYLLLNVSEKVAQNERTLFTFVSNDEPNSLARFVENHEADQSWIVGSDLIYDYFKGLFKKDVTNELIHNIWLSAEYAIDKCESSTEVSIVKALAVILAVNKPEELPATKKALKLTVHLDDIEESIDSLKSKNLIYKRGVSDTFAFKTRAGSALKTEIKKRREIKGDNVDYSEVLREISGKNYIVPRRYNAENMITRYFVHEYMSAEAFLDINDSKAFIDDKCIDGKVISLFSFHPIKYATIKKHFNSLGCNQLIVIVPENGLSVKQDLTDYEIIQDLKNNSIFDGDNEILKKELPIFEEDISEAVTIELYKLYGEQSNAHILYWDGKAKEVGAGQEESAVNISCEKLFVESPCINNEIINRNDIVSGQTKKARVNIIDALLSHTDTIDFYSGTNQEATVYRSLFIRTGLKDSDTVDKKLANIVSKVNLFIDGCSDKKTSLEALINELTHAPYGMRKGVLPLYLAFVFSQRNEDLILYSDGVEVQLDANALISICENANEYALFVSKKDVQKEKYIGELNQKFSVSESRNLTENRIKNIAICIQRWYRNLPQVTRNLVNLSDIKESDEEAVQMESLRKILQTIELNPYELLFVQLPCIYDTDDLSVVSKKLDKTITSFDDYFKRVVNLIVRDTIAIFNGRKNKDLYRILKDWYNKQSKLSKEGLHGNKTTSMMSYIENLNDYNDEEIAKSLAKIVTDVYVEDWSDNTIEDYRTSLAECKENVESIRDEETSGKMKLSFVDSTGNTIEKYYERAPEGSGSVLKNIIEDALDEYDDLSANDRVSILLEMIEKIIK